MSEVIFNETVEPGRKAGFAAIRADILKCCKECLMHNILSGVRVIYYLQTNTVNRFIIQFIDLQLSLLVIPSACFNKIVVGIE